MSLTKNQKDMWAFNTNSKPRNFYGILILLTIGVSCSKLPDSKSVQNVQGVELIPSSIWTDVIDDPDAISLSDSTSFTMDSAMIGYLPASESLSYSKIFTLREDAVKSISEILKNRLSGSQFLMDMPEPGNFVRFRFEEQRKSSIETPLPTEVKTFLGTSLDGLSVANIVITPRGFNCRIFSPSGSYVLEEVVRDNKSYVVSYNKGAVKDTLAPFREYPIAARFSKASRLSVNSNARQVVKVFRIAISTTGEFTAFYGSKEATRWAIREAVEQVSAIYKRELSIVLDLIVDDRLIFTDSATDPFTNNNADSVLEQNQRLLDGLLGNAKYDIGHVFTTDPRGGKACIGSAGIEGMKAKGTSGIERPYGHKFIIDYLAHEIGHQLGANHIFNSCSPYAYDPSFRNGRTAYEPGSGSTIMSYAGICQNDDLQGNSDEYFNTISYYEIDAHLKTLNGIKTFSLINRPPTLSIPVDSKIYIPKLTPFQLVAVATDPDNDLLFYCWEQLDCDSANATPVDTQTKTSPIFRSFPPTRTPTRIFPRLESFLDGFKPRGEMLPDQGRKLNFSVTVRDMRGGVVYSDIGIEVDENSGPFTITYPNKYVKAQRNTTMTIKWDKAATRAAPINCKKVRILISEDGGRSFKPITQNVDNDGEHVIMLAVNPTPRARIKIEAVDNVFFAVSDVDFEVE